jgi:DNA primase
VIPAGFLQDLLSRVDIVDVVGRHVELKRGGANLMGLCPFHAEKSPSFSVSPAKQFYYCFGCGASGDAIRFLTEHLGMSFVDAVDRPGRRAWACRSRRSRSAPRSASAASACAERRLSLTEVLQGRAFYREQLKASPEAIDYLKRRGLTGEIARASAWAMRRRAGAAWPACSRPTTTRAGRSRPGAPPHSADADDAPAARARRYDWFRDRVMFPSAPSAARSSASAGACWTTASPST